MPPPSLLGGRSSELDCSNRRSVGPATDEATMDYNSDMDSDEYNELVEAEAEEVRLNAEAEAAAKDGA